jgi:hypothetical protein
MIGTTTRATTLAFCTARCRSADLKILLALVALICGTAHADVVKNERTEGLNLELTPYFWAAGIDGKAQVGTRRVHFDQSFSDLIEHVDTGFMGLGIVSYDRFVVYADYDYISLSSDGKIGRDLIVPSGTKADVDSNLDLWTVAGGYRFDTFDANTIDVMIGTRTLSLDNSLKALGTRISSDSSVTDTIVMLRPSLRINDHWRFNPTLSYGLSGDSDTTYELMPQLQYQFADSFALRFGYKRLYYKENSGPKNAPRFELIDGDLAGLFVGVGWTFPSRR